MPLKELEIHLHEEIQHQVDQGFSEAEAFERSVNGMGQPKAIKREFEKDEGNFMKMTLKIGMSLLEMALGIGMT
ncbi:MAG: permease prefix domain 1-containing protein, partial [Acidimicrobiales bacterium]